MTPALSPSLDMNQRSIFRSFSTASARKSGDGTSASGAPARRARTLFPQPAWPSLRHRAISISGSRASLRSRAKSFGSRVRDMGSRTKQALFRSVQIPELIISTNVSAGTCATSAGFAEQHAEGAGGVVAHIAVGVARRVDEGSQLARRLARIAESGHRVLTVVGVGRLGGSAQKLAFVPHGVDPKLQLERAFGGAVRQRVTQRVVFRGGVRRRRWRTRRHRDALLQIDQRGRNARSAQVGRRIGDEPFPRLARQVDERL